MGDHDISRLPQRASDAERDRTIRVLKARSVEGRISHDTFVARMDLALRAQTRAELAKLIRDLPGPPPGLVERLTAVVTSFSELTRRLQFAWTGPRLPGLLLPDADRARVTIGRDPGNDLVLGDPRISRNHAELRREGEAWLLVDLGSMNGTRLNGWRVVEPVRVRSGDQVSFGAVSFRLAGRQHT